MEAEPKDLKQLGERLSREIDSAEMVRAVREPRWEDCRKAYNNESVNAYQPYEGAYQGHFNLMQVKLDQLTSTVLGVLLSQEPYFVSQVFDDESVQDKLDKTIQFFLEKDGYKEALKQALNPAAYCGVGWLKAEWDGEGFLYTAIEPDAGFVYPAWVQTIEDAKCYGDFFYLRKEQVEARQKKEWNKGPLVKAHDKPGDSGSSSGRPLHDEPAYEGHQKILIYDLIYEEDGKWYRCLLAKDTKLVLMREEWPYKAGWYGEHTFKTKPAHDGYYPASFPGQDLMQCQFDANEVYSTFMNGARYNAYPTTFVNGTPDTTKPILKAEPGGVYDVDTEGMQIFQPKVDMGALPILMSMILEHADRIIRVSNMASGQAAEGTDTATEASILRAGQQQAIDEFIETVSLGCLQTIKFMLDVLYEHWNEWFPKFGKHLDLEEGDQEIFKSEAIWRPSVASSGGTPQMQAAIAMQMLQTALSDANGMTGLEAYDVTHRFLQLAERTGFTNAEGLQRPQDIVQAAEKLAADFGLDEEAVYLAIASVANQQQSALAQGVGDMAGGEMLQQLPGGVAEEAGQPAPGYGDGGA